MSQERAQRRTRLQRGLLRLAWSVGTIQDRIYQSPLRWTLVLFGILLAVSSGGFRLSIDNRTHEWLDTDELAPSIFDETDREFFILVRRDVEASSDRFVEEDSQLAERLAAIPEVAVVESVSGVLRNLGKNSLLELGEGARFFDHTFLFDEGRIAVQRIWLGVGVDAAACREAVARVLDFSPGNFSLVGPAAFNAHLDRVSREESTRVIAWALMVVVLIQAFFFRSLAVAVTSVFSSVAGILFCLGILGWSGQSLNFLTINVPVLAFVISAALAIHPLCSWLRLQSANRRARRPSPRKVALRTFSGCLLSALTTAVGFSCLGMARVGAVREFGLLISLCIPVIFLWGLLTHPLIFRLTPVGRRVWWQPGRAFQRIVLNHGGIIRGTAIILFLVYAGCIPHLSVEHDPLSFFSDNDIFRRQCTEVAEDIGGLAPLEITVDLADERPVAENLRVLEKLVGAIESATGVDHAFSLLEPLRLASSLMRGGSPGTFGLPADDFTLELAYKMVSSDQETMERLASERAQVYRILLPLNLLGGNEFNGVVDQLERVEAEFPGVAVEPVGVVYRLMSVQATILHEQLLSLGFAALGIAVLVGSFFGSLRFMVLTLIVNTSPILVTGSAMALFDIPLDLITAMVASVALGISVDDTIHLLWEYRRSNGAHADRITVVLRRVGQPVIVTTLILVAGFCILGSARFPPISRFGWLAAATLGLSLLFQLLALPSLLAASPTNAEKKGTEDCAQEQPVPAHALPSSGWLEEKHEPDERSAHCAAEESHSRLPSR